MKLTLLKSVGGLKTTKLNARKKLSFKPKLVRDNIPEIINLSGKRCKYSIIEDEQYSSSLIEKMSEELGEFAESPCLEEAADMYEVFLAMLDNWKLNKDDVDLVAKIKRNSRGGFSKRVFLESITNSKKNT